MDKTIFTKNQVSIYSKKLIMYQNLQEPDPFTIFVVWYSAYTEESFGLEIDLKLPLLPESGFVIHTK